MESADWTPGPDAPTSARVNHAILGGWNCTAADRAKAAELTGICPELRQMALDSRLFTARALGYAADRGVRQFIDLGAGLPPPSALSAVHEMARSVLPAARVAYVDHDPEVTDHLRDVLLDGGREGIAAVTADLRDPGAVMSDPGLLEVIDPGRPVLIIMALVLHFFAGDRAQALAGEYMRRAAPGSCLAVSTPCLGDEAAWAGLRRACPGFTWNHPPADLRAFFGGLELVPPGVRPAAGLRPGWEDAPCCPGARNYVLGGIGRKA